MLTQTHQKYRLFLVTSDVVVILLSWSLAFYLRFHTNFIPVTKGIPRFDSYAALSVTILLVWVTTFSVLGIYRASSIMPRVSNLLHFLKAHLIAFFVFLALTYLFSDYRFSRVTLFYFAVLSGAFLILARLSLHWVLRAIGALSLFQKKVLIVGDGVTARAIAGRFQRHPHLGVDFIGFLNKAGIVSSGGANPVLGTYIDIEALVLRHQISGVIIALPREEAGVEDLILRSLANSTVEVQLVPDLQEYMVLGCSVESFEGMPVLTLNQSPITFGWMLVKRCFDFFLSAVALLILMPILLLVAVLVKATSRGPIFYSQERMGLDGVTFKMWKFRSMRIDAESKTGPVWAKPNDDRRTPIGAILRASSLDELPQFWNVLRGDMSLVGPRPERPQFVDQFRGNIPTYMYRHKVKAGITGWAQVNGWRGDTSLEKRIECDLYYIRNWSLTLDLKILLLTVFKGIVNKNAY